MVAHARNLVTGIFEAEPWSAGNVRLDDVEFHGVRKIPFCNSLLNESMLEITSTLSADSFAFGSATHRNRQANLHQKRLSGGDVFHAPEFVPYRVRRGIDD